LQTQSRTFKLCVGNEKLLVNLLDNQISKPETLIQWFALLALVILLAVPLGIFGVQMVRASDPYVKSVLSLTGDPVQGHAIFQINCAGCHGLEADGLVGPSLQAVSQRKSRYRLIRQVISGETPPMPKFQPSTQEMADLLSYLETL
jgi:mono/diheme cytochrome c family protein